MKILRKMKLIGNQNILKRVESEHFFRNYFYLILGVLIYSITYNLLFLKNDLVYGGVTGISIILKDRINPSVFVFIANIFLLLLSLILLGKKMTIKSVVGSLLYPLFIKLTSGTGNYIVIQNDNLLLVSIVGGVCVGFAAGIVFRSGYTTGGTDILNQIVSKYFKVSMGTSLLIIDGIIVVLGGFFFGVTRVLYALIILYIINVIVDKVMLGISKNKAVYITTNKDNEICNYLLNELKLGVTLIETKGGYTYKKDEMIMCIVSNSDYFKVKDGVYEIDPKAVILTTDAYQSIGIYGNKKF